MKCFNFALGCAVASSLMLGSTSVNAQAEDLDPTAVAAASRYALPVAFEGFLSRCNGTLSPSGYALTNSSRLHAKFSEGSDAAWPEAKAAMLAMTAEDSGEMSEMLEMLGDEALRPIVDGMIAGMVAQELKSENCESIERGLEILDPLPAENLAKLIGFVVEIGQRENAEKSGEARQ